MHFIELIKKDDFYADIIRHCFGDWLLDVNPHPFALHKRHPITGGTTDTIGLAGLTSTTGLPATDIGHCLGVWFVDPHPFALHRRHPIKEESPESSQTSSLSSSHTSSHESFSPPVCFSIAIFTFKTVLVISRLS